MPIISLAMLGTMKLIRITETPDGDLQRTLCKVIRLRIQPKYKSGITALRDHTIQYAAEIKYTL